MIYTISRWLWLNFMLVFAMGCVVPSAVNTTVAPSGEEPAAKGTAVAAESPIADDAISADADVIFVKATQNSNGTWRFDVTVQHPDTGWEDYADGWDVVLPDGTVLKQTMDDPFTRLLLHPHETEQPFTRSQSGLTIPDAVITVTVRAHDLVAGWGGQTITVDLMQASGEGFEVIGKAFVVP